MTLNKVMTYGSIAFAAFALYFITRSKPSGEAAVQPAQADRDAGLGLWNAQINAQTTTLADAFKQYEDVLSGKLSK